MVSSGSSFFVFIIGLILVAPKPRNKPKTPNRTMKNLAPTARNARIPLTLLLLACCAASILAQTTKRELTIEWIFGPEGRSVASVPTTAWLDDGTLVLY